MRTHRWVSLMVVGCLTLAAQQAQAHCQIPCGIFDETARIAEMREDVTTIRKSINEIVALSAKKDPLSLNQLVRWVTNKEHHADRIMRTIAEYFFAQKIKASDKDYLKRLADHHAVMVAAMVCKQTADVKSADLLSQAIDRIAGYWVKH